MDIQFQRLSGDVLLRQILCQYCSSFEIRGEYVRKLLTDEEENNALTVDLFFKTDAEKEVFETNFVTRLVKNNFLRDVMEHPDHVDLILEFNASPLYVTLYYNPESRLDTFTCNNFKIVNNNDDNLHLVHRHSKDNMKYINKCMKDIHEKRLCLISQPEDMISYLSMLDVALPLIKDGWNLEEDSLEHYMSDDHCSLCDIDEGETIYSICGHSFHPCCAREQIINGYDGCSCGIAFNFILNQDEVASSSTEEAYVEEIFDDDTVAEEFISDCDNGGGADGEDDIDDIEIREDFDNEEEDLLYREECEDDEVIDEDDIFEEEEEADSKNEETFGIPNKDEVIDIQDPSNNNTLKMGVLKTEFSPCGGVSKTEFSPQIPVLSFDGRLLNEEVRYTVEKVNNKNIIVDNHGNVVRGFVVIKSKTSAPQILPTKNNKYEITPQLRELIESGDKFEGVYDSIPQGGHYKIINDVFLENCAYIISEGISSDDFCIIGQCHGDGFKPLNITQAIVAHEDGFTIVEEEYVV